MTLAYFFFKGLASLTLDMFASQLVKWEISAMEFKKKNSKNDQVKGKQYDNTLGFEPTISITTISHSIIIWI